MKIIATVAILAMGHPAAQQAGGYSYLECIESGHGGGDVYRISASTIHIWNDGSRSWSDSCQDPDYLIRCTVNDRYITYEASSRANGSSIYRMRIQRSSGRYIFSTDGGSSLIGTCRSTQNPETAARR